MAYDDRRLLVGFKGDDLATRSGELQYYYWLEGWDKDWQSIRYYEIISYPPKNSPLSPFLEPGYYTLHLKAVDEDGNESKQARLDITVAEPPPPPTPLPTPLPLIKEIPKEVPVEIPVEPRYTIPGLGVSATLPQFLFGGIGFSALMVLVGFGTVLWRKRQQVRQNVLNKVNPYIAGPPIDDPELFVGREELINKIIRGIAGGNHQAVQGPRRSGKSSLLNELARRLRRLDDPKTSYVPVKFNCQSATQAEFFFKLMRPLRKTFNEMYPTLTLPMLVHSQRPETYTDGDFEDDLHTILEVWREAETKTLRIILLLDEGDTINLYDPAMQGKIRTIISDNKVLKMVWVGTNILEAAKNVGSPWYNLQITHLLPPLSPEDARALMLEPAQKLGYTFQPEAVERILASAQGQPYIVQYLCHYAMDIMLAAQRSQIILTDVETAIAQLELEKSAQDVNGVVYQARVPEEEAHLTLAEKPNLYDTSAEEDPT